VGKRSKIIADEIRIVDWRAEQEATDTPSEPSGQENDDAENQG